MYRIGKGRDFISAHHFGHMGGDNHMAGLMDSQFLYKHDSRHAEMRRELSEEFQMSEGAVIRFLIKNAYDALH